MDEKSFLEKILPCFRQDGTVLAGPGDDCAVIDVGAGRLLLWAVDQLVEGVHFESPATSPASAAAKLVRRNVSDIAAMGGKPSYALLTAAANFAGKGINASWIGKFMRAVSREASRWTMSVCGGDLASNPDRAVFTLSIAGWVEKDRLCLRSGARDGDLLYATGRFGNSFSSGHHLDFVPRLAEARFLAGRFTRAMIDVSDGLLSDAGQIAKASGLGLEIFAGQVLLRRGATLAQALGQGEDYELLFAVSPSKAVRLAREWPFKKTPLSRVGRFSSGIPCGKLLGEDGCDLSVRFKGGYSHM